MGIAVKGWEPSPRDNILHESLNPVMGLGIVLIVAGTYFIATS
ncbi:MAG TPA: hypothetical protein VEQ37_05915 [Actinomycetota bacterium]|nr:hypothetical protein [Actinomycetota bacterium]